jgi:hypothetical protein
MEEAHKGKNPCQQLACEIQKCLQQNSYSEKKCAHIIEAYSKCAKQYSTKKET